MLKLAAQEADIVNVNYDLREGRINPTLVRTGMAEATRQKIGWIEEAAGERMASIELSITIFLATVTDDPASMAASVASGLSMEASDILEVPHFLIGPIEALVETLRRRREAFGFSYVIVPGDFAEAFAPLVERLAGT